MTSHCAFTLIYHSLKVHIHLIYFDLIHCFNCLMNLMSTTLNFIKNLSLLSTAYRQLKGRLCVLIKLDPIQDLF